MEKEQSIYTFFDSILSGEIGELEIENFIESKTENFNVNKLELLLNDIQYYLFCEREDKMAEYSELEIQNALNEFAKRKIEIPRKDVLIFSKEKKLIPTGKTTLDIEKLLYPFYFFLFKN